VEVTWELVGLATAMAMGQAAVKCQYDGREAGIGASAGMEGDTGRSGQIGGGGQRGVLM
jgi:hypothetical protein